MPAEAFDDHRNSDPYDLDWRGTGDGEPTIIGAYQSEWILPSLRLNFSSADWAVDDPTVTGYDPDDFLDRRYLLELWVEKSTMDDILAPLTQELGIRLVPSAGYQSISNFVKLLQRVHKLGKPTRIFYVSDFDAAGKNMPIAAARQIEFWRDEFAPGSDIKLRSLVLTAAQVGHYKLPRSLDKAGATELDALEALHPGALGRIIRDAVAPYIDEGIHDDLADAKSEARRVVREEWNEHTKTHRQSLQALEKRVRAVTKKYEKELANLNKRLQRDLRQFKYPLAKLQSELEKVADEFDPDLPARPTQAPAGDLDESQWLYDSTRSYLEQLGFYKRKSQ